MDRLCNYYKVPLQSPTPVPSELEPDRSVDVLKAETGISQASVEEIQKSGFATVDRLVRIGESADFPRNLTFVTLLSDRIEVELLITTARRTSKNGKADAEAGESDLRQVLDRNRNQCASQSGRVDSHHRPHARRHNSRSSSKSDFDRSYSRSHSRSALAELSTQARKLPRAHKFILPKASFKTAKKLKPTDISVDELLAYDLRVCARLGGSLEDTYAVALLEYLDTTSFL